MYMLKIVGKLVKAENNPTDLKIGERGDMQISYCDVYSPDDDKKVVRVTGSSYQTRFVTEWEDYEFILD